MGLYAPTRWFRCTLTTVGALIEGPAENAPPGSYRKVHLLLLDSPTVEITLDCPPDSGASRDAYWARVPLNKQLCISILPHQTIVGRAQIELHELSVIVEHWHGGSGA